MTRRVVAAAIFGIVGVAVLIGLGVWQVQRLAWKEALIARLEQRLSAEPVALPAQPDSEGDAFLRVAAAGEIGDRAVHVLTSQKPWGPGFRVIAPLATDEGRTILVDLGYIPEEEKAAGHLPEGEVSVLGALYWPAETDSFTPEPDRPANIWFARDLAPMAETLDAEPLLVVAERVDGPGVGAWPKPLRLGVNLPNDHLEYAITWFSLAFIWAVMTILLVRRERRQCPRP